MILKITKTRIEKCAFSFNDVGQMLVETYAGGPLSGLSVTNGYDSPLRRTAVALSSQSSTLVQYGYDTAPRLAGVTNGSSAVGYGYLPNSPLVSTVTFNHSGTTRSAFIAKRRNHVL